MAQKPEEKILQAALEIVAENTISGTRMHLVSERAEMVQSNVHYYFKTKQMLLSALQDKVLNHHVVRRKEFLDPCGRTLEERLRAVFDQKVETILDTPQYDRVEIDFVVQGKIYPEMKAAVEKSFAFWRHDIMEILAEFSPQASTEKLQLVSAIVVSMMEGATVQHMAGEECFDISNYFKECQKMVECYLSCG